MRGFICLARSNLPRELFELRKVPRDRAGANLGVILDHAVEPAIDVKDGALPRLAIAAVGFARGKAQAADISRPAPHLALCWFGQGRVMYADRIVEIVSHESEHLGAVLARERLICIGIAATEKTDAPAVVAARAGRDCDRQNQDRRALCRYPQLQSVS